MGVEASAASLDDVVRLLSERNDLLKKIAGSANPIPSVTRFSDEEVAKVGAIAARIPPTEEAQHVAVDLDTGEFRHGKSNFRGGAQAWNLARADPRHAPGRKDGAPTLSQAGPLTTGKVRARDGLEAEINLTVIGTEDRSQDIVAVIDTGFTGDLTLPRQIAERLGLPLQGNIPVQTAGERDERANTYVAFVELDGTTFEVDVLEFEGVSLIGMRLLMGFRLTVEVTTGGEVTVERLT